MTMESIEFSPTKVRLVAWRCSPGRDLLSMERERMKGEKRMVGRESAGLREIV